MGWHTRYCCQGSPAAKWGAYIVFRGPYAEAFQQAVLSADPKWPHWIEPEDPEVIRFPQSGIEMALRALEKLTPV